MQISTSVSTEDPISLFSLLLAWLWRGGQSLAGASAEASAKDKAALFPSATHRPGSCELDVFWILKVGCWSFPFPLPALADFVSANGANHFSASHPQAVSGAKPGSPLPRAV